MTWLFAALITLPVCAEDRAPELAEAKRQQMTEIAQAIDAAVAEQPRWPRSKRELKVLLGAVGQHESAFCMRIGRGQYRRHESDPGPDGQHRAAGYWQLHEAATSSHEAWVASRTDVRVAAREAARALTRAYLHSRTKMICRGVDPIAATLSVYAGRRCDVEWRGRSARMATFRRLMVAPAAPAPKTP